MLGQVVVVYRLAQSQNWPFLGLKTTFKATDSAPRLLFRFTPLFSPPGASSDASKPLAALPADFKLQLKSIGYLP